MPVIKDEKLNAPFVPFDTAKWEYITMAKELANEFMKNGKIDNMELLKKVRIMACLDRDHLKGDYVVASFILSMVERKRYEFGKRLKIDERLVDKIFLNEITKELSVIEFCRQNPITRQKYYRVAKCNVKHIKDRQALLERKNNVSKND